MLESGALCRRRLVGTRGLIARASKAKMLHKRVIKAGMAARTAVASPCVGDLSTI